MEIQKANCLFKNLIAPSISERSVKLDLTVLLKCIHFSEYGMS